MANNNDNWYARISKIFRSPTTMKRRIRDYREAPKTSTAMELFSKSQSFVYSNAVNSYGQYDRLCIDLNTKIPVPGPERFKTLKQLIDEYGDTDEKFVVYSYDHNAKTLIPAWAHHPRSSGVRETVIVTFDDNSTLICTPDHPCMMRDGTFVDAAKLQPGDSMMPFYRREFNGKKDDKQFIGYSSIYTSNKSLRNGWISEHKLIAEWYNNRKVLPTEHVHHIDRNPQNNSPYNLQIMDAHEHLSMHGADTILQWKNPDIRKRMIDGLCNAWKNDDGTRADKIRKINQREDVIQLRRKHMLENNPTKHIEVRMKISNAAKIRNQDPQYREQASIRTKKLHEENKLSTHDNFKMYWEGKTRPLEWKQARTGINNPNYVGDITEAQFEACISKCGTDYKLVAATLDISVPTLQRRLKKLGYKGWSGFYNAKNNHKVVSVQKGPTIEVGDLTVDGYECFATDTIIVHNSRYADFSEMEYTPEISAALDIYADESVSQDEKGKSLHIFSDNRKVKQLLEELFYDTLNVDFNLRMWVRNIAKYGDFFIFNDVAPKYGIVQAFPIPVNEIEREEGYDPEDPQAVRFRWITQGNVALENWQVTHFRMLGNDAFLPYGSSLIEPARRVWRQLILIEDAMMVYRVVRSPERRIFYIDVGAIPPEEIDNYMQQQKANLRSNTIIDKTTGRVDLRYNPLSVDEDYFIARRGADSGTEITTLAGGQHVSATEDVEYIQKKLFAALKVPRAYLGYDEMLCLTGDTLIPLTDGRVVSLEEMVKMHQRGEELEVYSYDLVKNKIAAGKVTAAWKTKEVDELYEVQLDDGNIIKCTANHPFLGRDGQYYRADQLKIGQSLMPLYRRLSSKKKGEYLEGYEQTYDVKRNRWRYTHRLFGEQKYPRLTNKNVIHHANFDRKNNKTSNLLKFSDQATHQYFHAIHNRATKKYAGSNNPRFNHTANIDELIKIAADVGSFNELKEKSGYGIRVISRMLKEAGHTFQSFSDNYMPKATGSYRGKGYDVSYNDIDNVMKERYAAGKSLSYHAVAQQMSLPPIVVLGRIKNSKWGSWSAYKDSMLGLDAKTLREELCKYKTKTELYQTKYEKLCSLTKFNRMVKLATKPSQYNNHKVTAIHRVQCHKVSVYDLTVEGFHNFALVNPGDNNSGIFVHNSSKATLAQEDIRFSRTVQAIQKVVISELQKLAYIHLFMNGYEGSDMFDFELRLTNPSTIAQQQKLELYNRKFEVLGNALGIGEGRVFSQQYLLKTIMDMSEQQQKQLSDEVVEDVQRMAALGKIAEGAIPESVGFSNNGSFNNAAYDDAVGVDGADTEGGDDADGGDDPFGDLGGGGGGGMGDLGGGDDFGDLGGDEGGDEEEPIEDGQVRRGNVLGEKEEADTTRLSDVDDADESTTKLSDVDVWGSGPIKADPKARHRKYNSDRRRRSGRAALHMPDFARSTGMRDPQDDPFGDALGKPFKGALDKPFKNPFGEAHRSKGDVITSTLRGYMAAPKSDYEARPRITSEMQAIFDKLSEEFGATSNETAAMLTETDMMERLLREGGDLSTSETDEELNENNVKFFNDLIRDDD